MGYQSPQQVTVPEKRTHLDKGRVQWIDQCYN